MVKVRKQAVLVALKVFQGDRWRHVQRPWGILGTTIREVKLEQKKKEITSEK